MTKQLDHQVTVSNLNVAQDEGSIYQGGNLTGVSIEDLLDNEVAIRQLINELNLEKRANHRSRKRIEQLQLERVGYSLQPYLLVCFAVMNLIGTTLVGIGTNLITAANPAQFAGWILFLGALLAVITAASPIVLPFIIQWVSSKGVHNAD